MNWNTIRLSIYRTWQSKANANLICAEHIFSSSLFLFNFMLSLIINIDCLLIKFVFLSIIIYIFVNYSVTINQMPIVGSLLDCIIFLSFKYCDWKLIYWERKTYLNIYSIEAYLGHCPVCLPDLPNEGGTIWRGGGCKLQTYVAKWIITIFKEYKFRF